MAGRTAGGEDMPAAAAASLVRARMLELELELRKERDRERLGGRIAFLRMRGESGRELVTCLIGKREGGE